MAKYILIGGGELRSMPEINEMIVKSVGNRDGKPYALFFPQASYESKPYVNSFVREFGSRLKCKASCALWRNGEMDIEKIAEKINLADIIYIGGGKYDVLMAEFDKMGIRSLLDKAVESDKIIVGNSAGAMILAEKAVSDCLIDPTGYGDYTVVEGYGYVKANILAHADEIKRLEYVKQNGISIDFAIESYEFKLIQAD